MSDTLIPPDLRGQLIAAVSPLENFPDEEKDWHPRSDKQVLYLVHPSLYPVVYTRTFVKDPQTGKCKVLKPPDGEIYTFSEKFQWLPADFAVAEDGTVVLISPYINNAHPRKHTTPESVIPKLLERAGPLWGRVLSDMRRPSLSLRIKSRAKNTLPDCLFAEADEPQASGDSDEESETDMDGWLSGGNLKLPDAKERYTGDLDVMRAPAVSLKGATLQCIMKLANIVLIPQNPEYRQKVAR